MREITERQKEVLSFITNFTEANSYPPTIREIAEHFGISLKAVQDRIAALQKKGYLSSETKRSRFSSHSRGFPAATVPKSGILFMYSLESFSSFIIRIDLERFVSLER